jgi:homoserine O-acetyltransferase
MAGTIYFHKEITLSSHSEPAGETFPAKLAYRTYGSASNPAILMSSAFLGSIETTTPFLYTGDDAILSREKFFIIIVGLLGGGESSSPSNQPAPFDGPRYPETSYEDNVHLQYALCTEELGISKLFAYIGYSMGGQQAYYMASMYPDFVENMIGLSTSARTSWSNWVSLEGPRYALVTAHDFHNGHYEEPAKNGVKAFKRVQAARALSNGWFRQEAWKQAGFKSLDVYLQSFWTDGHDANDLLAMLWTWQHGDITVLHPEDKGDLAKVLGRIKARCLIFPANTDNFFPPEDSEEEVKYLENGELAVLESVWGHLAGGGFGPREDADFMSTRIKEFLKI